MNPLGAVTRASTKSRGTPTMWGEGTNDMCLAFIYVSLY
jgi:hypothetical protein